MFAGLVHASGLQVLFLLYKYCTSCGAYMNCLLITGRSTGVRKEWGTSASAGSDNHMRCELCILDALSIHRRPAQVLAWPCNQFGNQEPGDSRTISEFVKSRCALAPVTALLLGSTLSLSAVRQYRKSLHATCEAPTQSAVIM